MKKLTNKNKLSRTKLTWLSCILSFLIVSSVTIAASMAWFTGQDIINATTTVVGTSDLSWRNADDDIVTSFSFNGELEPGKAVSQVLNLKSLGTVANSYLRVLVETKLDNESQNVLDVVGPSGFDDNWIKSGNYYYYIGGEGETEAVLTANRTIPFATAFKLDEQLPSGGARRIVNIKIVAETLATALNEAELSPWEDAPNEWLLATEKKATMRAYTSQSAFFDVSDIAYSYNEVAQEYLVYTPSENNIIKIKNLGVNPHILTFDFMVNYYNAENVLVENVGDIVGFTYTATNSTENQKGKVFVKQDIETDDEYTITIDKLYIKTQGAGLSETERGFKVEITTANDIVAINETKSQSFASYKDLPGDFVYDYLGGTMDHYVSITNDVTRKAIATENNELLDGEDITITNLGEKPVALVFEIMTIYYSFEESVLTKYAMSSNPVSLTYANANTQKVPNGYLYLGTLAKNQNITIDEGSLAIGIPSTVDGYYEISITVLSYVFDTLAPVNPFPASQEVPNEWYRAVGLKAPFDLTIANGGQASNKEITYASGNITVENLGQQTAVFSLWFRAETTGNVANDVEILLNDANFYYNATTDKYYYYGSLASEEIYDIVGTSITIDYNTTDSSLTTIKVLMDAKPLTPTSTLFNADLPAKWYRSIGRVQEIDVSIETNGVEYFEKAPITALNDIDIHNYGTASIAYYLYFEELDNGSLSAVLDSDEYVSSGVASAKNYFYLGTIAPNTTETIEYAQLSGLTVNTRISIKCVKYNEDSNPFTNEVSVPNSWLRAMGYEHTMETIVEVTSTDSTLKDVALAANTSLEANTTLTNIGDYDALFYIEFQVEYKNDIGGEVSVNMTNTNFIKDGTRYYYKGTLAVGASMTILASEITYSNPTEIAGEQFRIKPVVICAKKDGANNPFPSAPYKWKKEIGLTYTMATHVEVISTDETPKNVAIADNAALGANTVLENIGDYDALFYVEFQVEYLNDIVGEVSVNMTNTNFIKDGTRYYYNGTLAVGSSVTIPASEITYSNPIAIAGEQFIVNPEVTCEKKDGANNPFPSAPYKWKKAMNLTYAMETVVEVIETDEMLKNVALAENAVLGEDTVLENIGDYDALFYVEFEIEYLTGSVRVISINMTNSNFTESNGRYYYNNILAEGSRVTIPAADIKYTIPTAFVGEQFRIIPVVTFEKKDGTNNPFASSPNAWAVLVGVELTNGSPTVANFGTSIIPFTELPIASNTIEFTNASANDIIYRISYIIEYYKDGNLVDEGFEEMLNIAMPNTFAVGSLYYYYKGKGLATSTVSFNVDYAKKDGVVIPDRIDGFKVVYEIETKQWDNSKTTKENIWQFPYAPSAFFEYFGENPPLNPECENLSLVHSLPTSSTTVTINASENITLTNGGGADMIAKIKFLVYYYDANNDRCEINENITSITFNDSRFLLGEDGFYYFKHIMASTQSISFIPNTIRFENNPYVDKKYQIKVQYETAVYDENANAFGSVAPDGWFVALTDLVGG